MFRTKFIHKMLQFHEHISLVPVQCYSYRDEELSYTLVNMKLFWTIPQQIWHGYATVNMEYYIHINHSVNERMNE